MPSSNEKTRTLTASQLASLDALITRAQENGRSLTDTLSTTEQVDMAEIHQAMWNHRHGGIEINDEDIEILGKIRDLAAKLKIAPTLQQLVEMRGEAVRKQSGR
jgi:hypothetical protein